MRLPPAVIGVVTFSGMLGVLLFWGGLMLLPATLLKALLLPFPATQRPLTRYMVWVGRRWAGGLRRVYRLCHGARWRIEDETRGLRTDGSYLLVCNHQSWADILILFELFHGRAPFLRFFLKQELMWVPIIGAACWGMEMPFMKRHSREAIAANPALRNEDLETTRRTCQRYRGEAITVVNFLEGTRYTPAKHAAKGSPFRHLLRPKSAGLSFTLNAMGDQFDALIDVTLHYQPSRRPLLWSWLCGEQRELRVHLVTRPLPEALLRGNYEDDPGFRARFQHWVNALWLEKDARLAAWR
ncbi:MAG TPA: acyltransferase [Nevskiaceae bacterium]|nr:acyltransferase [Nevskiaceae bacterium]